MPRTILLPALLGLLVLSTACDASGTGPSAEGRWGGQTASLQLAPAGGAIQYQCGAGTIDSGWTLSTRGTFRATGAHFFGGGPLPPGGVPGQAARYAGQVTGATLVFTVTLVDLGQVLGPFRLVRDGPTVADMCV